MPNFTITTTRREFTVEAHSPEHARQIVLGDARPISVPPAPRPADRGVCGRYEPTPEWAAWFAEHRPALWRQRLDFATGESILCIGPATEEEA